MSEDEITMNSCREKTKNKKKLEKTNNKKKL